MPCDRVGCPNVATVRVRYGETVVSYYCRPCAKIALERQAAEAKRKRPA